MLIIAQIETRDAVQNVDGIDACYIGPMDLSLSYGLESPRYDHPEFLGAFDRVLAAAKKWGKPAGMFTLLDNVEWAIEKGFTLITVDSADISLVRGARMALKKANNGDRSRF